MTALVWSLGGVWTLAAVFKNEVAGNILLKIGLWSKGAAFMCCNREMSGVKKDFKRGGDTSLLETGSNAVVADTRRVVFVRHGESEWNEVFNRGFAMPGFLARIVSALIKETVGFSTRDSTFLDSPLNELGIQQAVELMGFLEQTPPPPLDQHNLPIGHGKADAVQWQRDLEALRGEAGRPSVLATSNLRRAIVTTVVAFWGRLRRTREKVFVLSDAQEMARNVDTIALTPPNAIPHLPRLTAALLGNKADTSSKLKGVFHEAETLDVAFNKGNKPMLKSGSSMLRMRGLGQWCFDNTAQGTTVIVGGHSHFFRYFFRAFLPASANHIGKVIVISPTHPALAPSRSTDLSYDLYSLLF